ncbi:nucleotidyltransferase family protein [Phormidesmis priestleyi]|uniref:nucleotidyltransferase family protein n=1 Tax=Phormidesmis priestleyi TaxID=268141 RepID=UPI00083A89F3|nr:nucleotidyltransferase domain-containing protein [Phormidesmis priestleyi]
MEFSLHNDKMQGYISIAQRRSQSRLEQLVQRRAQGMEVSRKAANLLKQEFGVGRVVLFGSVLGEDFHESSDLDPAVWGLPESLYFKAIARLEGLDGFAIDLVEAQHALPHIADAIKNGIDL